ncbi:MAG: NACHT domain-containing protein [Limisphaerales bacterium]
MTTLEKLQELDDAKFHELADTLLRRVEPRFRNLRPHGLSDRGRSIKGQPDSYVGNTASTCQIAFCYTTQQAGWWTKVVADITDAAGSSSEIEEIVVALPRDVDREGPKDKSVNWMASAKKEAGEAILTFYDGRRISRYLDEDYQDIRLEYFGTPYSRLSQEAMLLSCGRANQDAIADLSAKGRYAPGHYVFREADSELRRIWTRAFSPTSEGSRRRTARLIPLVNDSGVGKTSLLCAFAEATDVSVPVLLVQARDCLFTSEDALVRMVVQKLQGVLDPALRAQEEAVVARLFNRTRPLTVLLDGLDETRTPGPVGTAIKFWIESQLGKRSILMVSCRPDFWRRCSEASWEVWIPEAPASIDRALVGASQSAQPPEDRIAGFALPGLFSQDELRSAWVKMNLGEGVLQRLSEDLRQELCHPFTFRACAELFKKGGSTTIPRTRGEIVEAWLNERLKGESDRGARISPDVYWRALTEIARLIQASGETAIAVDNLTTVPRFNAANPPGLVVERLINANVLEVLGHKCDSVRFVFDTVFELFAAEADVEDIKRDRQSVMASLMERPFSTICTRLNRLGQRIAGTAEGNDFLKNLICADYAKALAALQSLPNAFSQEVRQSAFGTIESAYLKARQPEMAFIVERLGYIDCAESRDLLRKLVLPWHYCPAGLHIKAAYAAISLELLPAIPLLAACGWFGGYPYYHRELLSLLRATSTAFRDAFASHAFGLLSKSSGTQEHALGVSILAYLGDSRLAQHLGERLDCNSTLQGYENHALLALGTAAAGEVFIRSARAAAAALSKIPKEDGAARAALFHTVSPRSEDMRYIVRPAVERHILGLVDDADKVVSSIGIDIATSSRNPRLIRHLVFTNKYQGMLLGTRDINGSVGPSDWIGWWNSAPTDDVRLALLSLSGNVPDVRVEDRAINSLHVPSLRSSAAYALSRIGSTRCLPALRACLDSILQEGSDALAGVHGLVLALGVLRDNRAVEMLDTVVRRNLFHARSFALDSLARIGTEGAAKALLQLAPELDKGTDVPEDLVTSLIAHGSPPCVGKVLELAKQHPDGPRWLARRMCHVFFIRGYTPGEYYTHVDDEPLIDFLIAGESEIPGAQKRDLVHAVEQIDSEEARRMLRMLASRAGTDRDTVVRDDKLLLSREAHEELMRRGDDFSVPYYVSKSLECRREAFSYGLEELANFRSIAIASEVAERLGARPVDPEHTARLLSLLGRFGAPADARLVDPYLAQESELVRNVAYEAKVRLTDPLRLPSHWQEILAQ